MSEEFNRDEMRSHQANLAELQRIDSELMRVKQRLAGIPKKIESLQKRLRDDEARLQAFLAKGEDHVRERRECEREIRGHDEKIKQLEGQLFRVKTQREYDAIGQEVAGLRQQISAVEDRELRLIDDEDRHRVEATQQQAALAQLRAEVASETTRLEATRAEDERTVEALERDRPRFAEGIPEDVLVRYEILKERFPDNAVTEATSQKTCGGCSIQLISQTLLSLDLGKRFTFCEHCGRLLIPHVKAA